MIKSLLLDERSSFRSYEGQCQGQASGVINCGSCPVYKDTVIPIRPGYLRQKGDRETLMKIARRRCQAEKYWEK